MRKMKKIAYLHGLDSESNCNKVKWLRSLGCEVLNPAIDYRNDPIDRIITFVESFKPDLVIGSSMGGYLAYIISRRYNIPSMLLNPALHSRAVEVDVGGVGEYKPKMYFVFGDTDTIINPLKTISIITDQNLTPKVYTGSHGHRTPVEVLKKAFAEFKII